MGKKFKVKAKNSFGDSILQGLGRFFKKKPQIINLNESEIEKKSIMIGNHNGAGGAFSYRTFLDHRFMTWGAHPMCEGYNSRRKYLYHIFYRKKLHYSKFKSFLLSISFGLISKIVYGYAGIIPVYYDSRIRNTYKYSFQCLEKDVSVFVFPENSESGYKDTVEEFYAGFLQLSKLYYRKFQVDLPIYSLYYAKDPKTIIIGKPMYFQELLKENSEDEILEIFRNYMNSLSEQVPAKIKK